MNFGKAIEKLKVGKKVARQGWNGKGMFLKLIDSGGYSIREPIVDDKILSLLSWIGMKTADNSFVPWIASQTDMLAEDWVVIENE